jgi:hypothetical protein
VALPQLSGAAERCLRRHAAWAGGASSWSRPGTQRWR